MALFKTLLLIAVFVLHSIAGAAESVHTCCGGMDDCTVVQCAAMGCLAQQPPAHASPSLPPLPVLEQPAPLGALQAALPAPVQEIWCPPD